MGEVFLRVLVGGVGGGQGRVGQAELGVVEWARGSFGARVCVCVCVSLLLLLSRLVYRGTSLMRNCHSL